MSKWEIKYDEGCCIGCGACTVQCPKNWELAENAQGEFKAKVKVTKLDDIGKNAEAAEVCPVDCIVIEEVKE